MSLLEVADKQSSVQVGLIIYRLRWSLTLERSAATIWVADKINNNWSSVQSQNGEGAGEHKIRQRKKAG